MSTKIYEAYQVPVTRLNEFIAIVREDILNKTAYAIKMLALNLKDDYVFDEFNKAVVNNKLLKPKDDLRHRYHLALVPLLEEASKKEYKSFFCMDSSFNIWIDGEFAYLIPYLRVKFDAPEWAIDYSYWDNTDKPDNVTKNQWSRRQRTWERICLNDWDKTRMVHTIVSYEKLSSPGRIEIEKILGLW